MYRILAILILVSVTCLVGVGGDSNDNVFLYGSGLQANGLNEYSDVKETVSGVQSGYISEFINECIDPVSSQ